MKSTRGLLLRLPGDHDDLGDVTRGPGRTCKKRFPGELRRACPARQPEEIKRMCGGRVVSALFPRMMISQLAEDDGSHGSALGRRILLPIETEALIADATANVLPKLGPSEENLHDRRPDWALNPMPDGHSKHLQRRPERGPEL